MLNAHFTEREDNAPLVLFQDLHDVVENHKKKKNQK
jgi:hypothetical protein